MIKLMPFKMNMSFHTPKKPSDINNSPKYPLPSNNINGRMGMNLKFLNTVMKNCSSCGRG